MTFSALVTAVQDRLNLSSADSTARIGREINDRYKRVTSSIGLNTSRRTIVTKATTIGARELVFANIEKIISVYDTSSGTDRVLAEVAYDELRNRAPGGEPPQQYAISKMGAQTVSIYLDVVPITVFTLTADGYALASTLSGAQEPAFSESYHDILMHGAIADELRKLEKFELATEAEALYESRLSELRYFIAKSSYLQIFQGGRGAAPGGAGGGGGGGAAVPGSHPVSVLLGTANRTVNLDGAGQGVAGFITDALVDPAAAIVISKLANGAALSAVGNATNAPAAHTDIAAATDGHLLRRTGTALGFAAAVKLFSNTETGAINNWAPVGTVSGDSAVEWSGAADAAVTGLVAGYAGQQFYLRNTGAKTITFAHASGASAAANRFTNTGSTVRVGPGEYVLYIYSGTSLTWLLVYQSVMSSGVCQGRLTLTSGTPVTTADVTLATTIYFTPYGGNEIDLYSGTNWVRLIFTEASLALGTLTSGLPYDIFGYNNGGTLGLELLAWTNGTTRATALVLQDGVLSKTGALTRRYLGTFYTTSTTQTEDSFAKRFVWNYYNRVTRALQVYEGTDSWTYTTATWRQAGGSTGNQVAAIIGVAEVAVRVRLSVGASNTVAAVRVVVSIAQDSVGNPAVPLTQAFGSVTTTGVNYAVQVMAFGTFYPAAGFRTFIWQEYSEAAGTTTWFGDNAGLPIGPHSGIIAELEG